MIILYATTHLKKQVLLAFESHILSLMCSILWFIFIFSSSQKASNFLKLAQASSYLPGLCHLTYVIDHYVNSNA